MVTRSVKIKRLGENSHIIRICQGDFLKYFAQVSEENKPDSCLEKSLKEFIIVLIRNGVIQVADEDIEVIPVKRKYIIRHQGTDIYQVQYNTR